MIRFQSAGFRFNPAGTCMALAAAVIAGCGAQAPVPQAPRAAAVAARAADADVVAAPRGAKSAPVQVYVVPDFRGEVVEVGANAEGVPVYSVRASADSKTKGEFQVSPLSWGQPVPRLAVGDRFRVDVQYPFEDLENHVIVPDPKRPYWGTDLKKR